MDKALITDPQDNSYPFPREVFEDRTVVYHGSWSTYSHRIEAEGLLSGSIAFDLSPFEIVTEAVRMIGRESFVSAFYTEFQSQPFSAREVFFAPSFWAARSYAMDAGGEVVRKTIQDAEAFERICLEPEARQVLIDRWKEGLRSQPDHAATKAAVAALHDEQKLMESLASVQLARKQLAGRGVGGYPVVYAVRVEPAWFGQSWDRYLRYWHELGVARGELKCRATIASGRLIARADYPNGTDPTFSFTHFTNWSQLEEVNGSH